MSSAGMRNLGVGVLVGVLFAVVVGGASAEPVGTGPGNSPNAKQCQKGGWQHLYTSTGQAFANEGQCASYAAGGGTLLQARTLAVATGGTGAGTVSGPGIDCGSDCTEVYPDGTVVELTASPGSGSTFAGWSGACSGTGTCTVTMDANKTVSATFTTTPPTRTLTVSKTGSGTVTGTGIDCGSDCSESYDDGTVVTLTATPDAGWTFDGWSAPCSGTGSCTVTMNADTTVPASFSAQPFPPETPDIFLGFADQLDGLGITPMPWASDQDVVFLGCTTADECGDRLTAGAIRIDNTTSSALTLVDAYVDIGDCHFAPWGNYLPATAGPGETFVLTQTGVQGPPQPFPCDGQMSEEFRPYRNFDTSLGPFPAGTPVAEVCAPNATEPVITLVFSDGTTLTVTDTGQVLNTGGVDQTFCFAASESTDWTEVAAADIVRSP